MFTDNNSPILRHLWSSSLGAWDLFQLVGHDGRFVSVFLASSSFGQGCIKTHTRGISPYLTIFWPLSYFYAPCCCLFSFCLVVKLFAHISTLMCISLNGNHLEAIRQSLFIHLVVVGQLSSICEGVVLQSMNCHSLRSQ